MQVVPDVCPGPHPSVPPPRPCSVALDLRDGLQLVDAVVRQVLAAYGPVLPLDDMTSLGRMGLLEAMDRFDSERGTSFRRFAACRIRGAILDGMRREACLPRRAFEAAEGALPDAEDADPDGEEATAGLSPEGALVRSDLVRAAMREIDDLPPIEAALVRRHVLGDEPLEKLAPELGMSASWASRVLSKAMGQLRQRLERGGRTTAGSGVITPRVPGQAVRRPRPIAPQPVRRAVSMPEPAVRTVFRPEERHGSWRRSGRTPRIRPAPIARGRVCGASAARAPPEGEKSEPPRRQDAKGR